ENIAAPEALEKILQSIEFGNARGLRAAGIRVDFTRAQQIAELQLGRTLTDNEVVTLRYNAVMKAAANLHDAAAAAAGSLETQTQALAREVNELREAIGEKFQGYMKSWVGYLRDLVGFLKDNADSWANSGTWRWSCRASSSRSRPPPRAGRWPRACSTWRSPTRPCWRLPVPWVLAT